MKGIGTLISLALLGVVGAAATDDCFERLPFGCTVVRSDVITGDQKDAVSRRLGVPLSKLSNTTLQMQGTPLLVNILEAETEEGARKLHGTLGAMRKDPAFCLLRGRKVIEFAKVDANTATKAAYELGFVKKPQRVTYRITALVATLKKADYMAFNELFNVFRSTDLKNPTQEATSRIATLSKGFTFGESLTMRARKTNRFTPEPVNADAQLTDRVVYSFSNPPKVLGVPYVKFTGEIVCDGTGLTSTDRKPDASLLSATPYWPVGDPEIVALARRITAGHGTTEAKVRTLLEWLQPGRNIKSAGPTGSRWGVKKVLEQKYGHCWDSSDCFVTLARATGIPARQVGGWLFGTSGHIWAEVLVAGKGWQQVDPTGGGRLECGIYHIPYFVSEDGEMPILYVSLPRVEIAEAQ